MSIKATQVKELRDKSGVGMMECKKALVEASGDIDKAFDLLRKSGIAKAQKKSGRSAKEGNVISYIHPGSKLGVLLEVNCETDFVSNTDDFKQLCKDIAMHIAATNPVSVNQSDVPEDILDKEDVPLSLKLIKKNSDLKGSQVLLQNTFDRWGKITYIVASKEVTKELNLIFYELELTKESFEQLLADGHILLRKNQFFINRSVYQQKPIGTISLGDRAQLRALGQRYADRLGDSLFTIYELLENLSNNINDYFLEANKEAGQLAHTDALNLQNKIKFTW